MYAYMSNDHHIHTSHGEGNEGTGRKEQTEEGREGKGDKTTTDAREGDRSNNKDVRGEGIGNQGARKIRVTEEMETYGCSCTQQ